VDVKTLPGFNWSNLERRGAVTENEAAAQNKGTATFDNYKSAHKDSRKGCYKKPV
jgi:hypothetical protein